MPTVDTDPKPTPTQMPQEAPRGLQPGGIGGRVAPTRRWVPAAGWLLGLLLAPSCAMRAAGPLPTLSAQAPADNPQSISGDNQSAVIDLFQRCVALSQQTWPAVRQRFAAGLPSGEVLSVYTPLVDAEGRGEPAFVAVSFIQGDLIVGRIFNDPVFVKGYALGQEYRLSEEAVMDWVISRPDGSEEGNCIGKGLDLLNPPPR